LIVDDDPTYISLLSKQIKSFSNEYNLNVYIESVNDPIEALNNIYFNLKENNLFYEIIFIDENMPFLIESNFIIN
jgi:CheY-like chemotaxis protein